MNDIDRLCALLPDPYHSICKKIDDEFLPVVINFLIEEEPPKKVCEQIGFCHKIEKFVPKSSPEECNICEYVADFVEKWLAENKTEMEIEELLSHACAVLPDPYKNMCDQIDREYLPYLINLLEEEFPAKKVCQLVNLCPKATSFTLPQPNDECGMCKLVVQYVETWLAENKTEQEIEGKLDQLCELLPSSFATQCENLLKEYLPMIIAYVEHFTPEEICQLIGLCSSSSSSNKKHSKKRNRAQPNDNCSMCKMVVQYVDSWLAENKTEEEIEEYLDKYCKMLPSQYSTECVNLVTNYLPMIINYVEHFTPDEICKLVGLCTSRKKMKRNAAAAVVGDSGCMTCKMVIIYVDEWLKENASVSYIEDKIETVCRLLPSSMESVCDNLVEEFVPEIIEWVEEFTPEEVCELIGQCNKTTKRSSSIKNIRKMKRDAISNNNSPSFSFFPCNDACLTCKMIVTYVDEWLKENATVTEIEQKIELICKILPGSVQNACDQLVEEYIPQVIEWIEHFTPQEICVKIGQCNSTLKRVKKFVKKHMDLEDDDCSLCKLVVGYVDKWLKENRTEEEIEGYLDQLCAMLPKPYQTQCDQLVKEYLPMIINYVEQLSPEDICKLIGMCSKVGKKHRNHRHRQMDGDRIDVDEDVNDGFQMKDRKKDKKKRNMNKKMRKIRKKKKKKEKREKKMNMKFEKLLKKFK